MSGNHYLLTNLLSGGETKVIESIVRHIEKGEKRVGIQQIANENYISTTSIMKMCKRLGFDGYSDLYYHLSRRIQADSDGRGGMALENLVDNFSGELVEEFCKTLYCSRNQKMFTTGQGFSDIVVSYLVQRLSVSGFLVYNHVNFYDFMFFRQDRDGGGGGAEPSVMFAISQSGETEPVINDVRQARQQGCRIVSFTKRNDSTLTRLSDVFFVIDGSKQTLLGGLPNFFFGHVILAIEELMGYYFGHFISTVEKEN